MRFCFDRRDTFLHVFFLFPNVTLHAPRAELNEQNDSATVSVDICELSCCLLSTQIHADDAAAVRELVRRQPTVVITVDLLELVPEVVEVHDIPEGEKPLPSAAARDRGRRQPR